MEEQKRNEVIDVLKGLGIILMVAGHSGFPFTKFIYLFHMAIFFMAAGFCYKTTNSDSINNFISFFKRKFIALWLPYIIWTSIFSLLHNVFIKLNIYITNSSFIDYTIIYGGGLVEAWSWKEIIKNILKSFLLSGGTKVGGALWFICILIKVSLLYCFIDLCIKKICNKPILFQGLVSVILLTIGYFLHLSGIKFLSLDKVFSYYYLFYFGYILKQYNVYNYFDKWVYRFCIFLFVFISLIICNKYGKIELADTEYTNPLFFILTSVLGWHLIYEISYFLSKSKKLSKIIITIGRNTLSVVILHFLCFKIVNLIAIKIEETPIFLISCFPVYKKTEAWWLLYCLIGVGIPVILSILYKNIKQTIVTRCFQNEQYLL